MSLHLHWSIEDVASATDEELRRALREFYVALDAIEGEIGRRVKAEEGEG